MRDSYLNPEVDDSSEKFEWGKPDLDLIRRYAKYSITYHCITYTTDKGRGHSLMLVLVHISAGVLLILVLIEIPLLVQFCNSNVIVHANDIMTFPLVMIIIITFIGLPSRKWVGIKSVHSNLPAEARDFT